MNYEQREGFHPYRNSPEERPNQHQQQHVKCSCCRNTSASHTLVYSYVVNRLVCMECKRSGL